MPSTGTRHVHKAIAARWVAIGLNTLVRSLRSDPDDPYETLHDTQAPPRPVFPYVVFQQEPGMRGKRQSYGKASARDTRNTIWRFRVHARNKSQAAQIADAIMDAFDGHVLCMDVGKGISMDHQFDVGMPTDDDDQYVWVVEYNVRFDAVVNP